jgi:hypothetical protein
VKLRPGLLDASGRSIDRGLVGFGYGLGRVAGRPGRSSLAREGRVPAPPGARVDRLRLGLGEIPLGRGHIRARLLNGGVEERRIDLRDELTFLDLGN